MDVTDARFDGEESSPAGIGSTGAEFVGFATDIGLKRTNNEDNLLCDQRRGLYIVADGVGGAEAGEEASTEVVRFLWEYFSADRIAMAFESGDDAVESFVLHAIAQTHVALLKIVEANPEWKGMASTVVVGLLGPTAFYVANLGDSRAYRVQGEAIELLTSDHSVAAALIARGELTPAAARRHPLRNQLTGVLGGPQYRDPHWAAVPLAPGDRFVLCTDGLWDYVEDEEIASIVAGNSDPRETVHALIDASYEAGAPDNVTVIVIHIKGGE